MTCSVQMANCIESLKPKTIVGLKAGRSNIQLGFYGARLVSSGCERLFASFLLGAHRY